MTPSSIVDLIAGAVQGTTHDGVSLFVGIPFAAPPVGDLRFAAPAPVERWDGVRPACERGPNAPHRIASTPRVDLAPITGGGWVKGDDYLTLNVWAPADASNLPVMVWVHGGGLVLGSKDAPVQDGTRFAQSGVVSVAINYRLGAEGFAPIPGGATNIGLRDVVAALEWVRDNIAAFGGDPTRVTLFGESGGGMVVSCLLASPLAEGLFRRAIVQSGHGSSVASIDIGRRLVDRLAKLLQIEPNVVGFRSRSWEQVLDAQARIARPWIVDLRDDNGFDPGFGLGRFNPVVGDDVLPEAPLAALAAGLGRNVDLLIGTTSEEANAFLKPLWLDRFMPGFAARWMLGKAIPRSRDVLAAYGAGHGARPGEALARALTDLAFVWPAHQYAAAHTGRTHVYSFDWRSPTAGIGACHGLDLPFVFDTLDAVTGPKGIVGPRPPQELARRVHSLWVDFAQSGDLPWPEFEASSRQVRLLSADLTVDADIPPVAAFAGPHLTAPR